MAVAATAFVSVFVDVIAFVFAVLPMHSGPLNTALVHFSCRHW